MSQQQQWPQKWWDAVVSGTTAGNEETKFFRALARNPKFDWRSPAALAAETGLSKLRVEEILKKYEKKGIVFTNPKNDEQWGYWELHKNLVPKAIPGIAAKDTKKRVDKVTDMSGITQPKKSAPKKSTPMTTP